MPAEALDLKLLSAFQMLRAPGSLWETFERDAMATEHIEPEALQLLPVFPTPPKCFGPEHTVTLWRTPAVVFGVEDYRIYWLIGRHQYFYVPQPIVRWTRVEYGGAHLWSILEEKLDGSYR